MHVNNRRLHTNWLSDPLPNTGSTAYCLVREHKEHHHQQYTPTCVALSNTVASIGRTVILVKGSLHTHIPHSYITFLCRMDYYELYSETRIELHQSKYSTVHLLMKVRNRTYTVLTAWEQKTFYSSYTTGPQSEVLSFSDATLCTHVWLHYPVSHWVMPMLIHPEFWIPSHKWKGFTLYSMVLTDVDGLWWKTLE